MSIKKLLLLSLIAVGITPLSFASKSHKALVKTGKTYRTVNDVALKTTGIISTTFLPESFGSASPCASSIGIYGDSSIGYLAGVNVFGDQEQMMRYNLGTLALTMPATIDTVYGIFGMKYQSGNGKLRAKIYSSDGAGAPLNLIGTSADVAVSAVDTSGKTTKFVFTTPVSLTTSFFFVSIDISSLYASADTVALLSTDDQCASTDPMGAWTKLSDNTFLPFSDPNNWNSAMDLAIFAHVTARQLSASNPMLSNMKISVFPQPAQGTAYIGFTAPATGFVTIALKDITGKTISTTNTETLKGNGYKVPFDVSKLSNGLYFAEINSGNEKGMLKLVVKQ